MNRPRVHLVGAGVVGREILRAHVEANCSVTFADQDAGSLQDAVRIVELPTDQWTTSPLQTRDDWLPTIDLVCKEHSRISSNQKDHSNIVVESVSERLDVKRDFFAKAEQRFPADAILCSNTSTLRIDSIAESLSYPERFGGMHFFMPVDSRHAVEVVRGAQTSPEAIDIISRHVKSISKQPLVVADQPGFIVNRLLSPYLNEAMLLLGRGVSAEEIEHAALRYGMPISPLELIDWIGTRTMFDAGRVFWQSFPDRFIPSPILPRLIKVKRFGRATGGGFYDYVDAIRSASLSNETIEIVQRYQVETPKLSQDDILNLLAVPMWIEASIALRAGVAESPQQFDLAMRGGLGFDESRSWLDFFESIASPKIAESIGKFSPTVPCMTAPIELLNLLKTNTPTRAMTRFSAVARA